MCQRRIQNVWKISMFESEICFIYPKFVVSETIFCFNLFIKIRFRFLDIALRTCDMNSFIIKWSCYLVARYIFHIQNGHCHKIHTSHKLIQLSYITKSVKTNFLSKRFLNTNFGCIFVLKNNCLNFMEICMDEQMRHYTLLWNFYFWIVWFEWFFCVFF